MTRYNLKRVIGGAVLAGVSAVFSFNALARNTSGIETGAYMGRLSAAVGTITQDGMDRAHVGGFSSKLDDTLAQGASPDLQFVQYNTTTTDFAGFIEPNDGRVSVCVTKGQDDRPIGAWEISSKGVSAIPLDGNGCVGYGRALVSSYKAKGVKFVSVNPPPRKIHPE